MKNWAGIILLFFTSLLWATDDECISFRRGDFNGDGSVNTSDALALFNHLQDPTNPDKLPYDGQMDRADVDDDGDVDGADGSMLYGHTLFNTPATLSPPFSSAGYDIYDDFDNLANHPGCDLDSSEVSVTYYCDDAQDWSAVVAYNNGWDVYGEYSLYGYISAYRAKTTSCHTPNPLEPAEPTCLTQGYFLYSVPPTESFQITKRMIESDPSANINVYFEYAMTLSVKNNTRCDPYSCGDEYGPYDTQIVDFLGNSVEVQLKFLNSSYKSYVVAQKETQSNKYRYNYTYEYQGGCKSGYSGVNSAFGYFDSDVDPDITNGYVLTDQVNDDDILYLYEIKIIAPDMILHVEDLNSTLLTSYEISFHIKNVEYTLNVSDID